MSDNRFSTLVWDENTTRGLTLVKATRQEKEKVFRLLVGVAKNIGQLKDKAFFSTV